MTPCDIRPATESDAAVIAAIYDHYVRTTSHNFEYETPDTVEIAQRMETVRHAGLPYLVAEVNGRIVGYAYAAQFRPRPAYRFAVEDSLYVDQEWAGRGIGHQLLAALIEGCRKAGMKQMVAGVGGDNPASVALHLGLGFKHAGILRNVGYKFERWLDLTLMQRTL
jgi:L-amino acid N-acyltransferase YncA